MQIDYRIFTRPKTILLTSLLSVFVISFLVYFNPENQGWWNSSDFSWGNLLRFLFIDQILFECLSVFISFSLLRVYAYKLTLNEVDLSRRGILKYQITFLPIVFLAFFVFNPLTQTLRFFYHYFPELDWSAYFDGYFYSIKLYLTYLPVVFLQIYFVLNINLIYHYEKQNAEKSNDQKQEARFIKVNSDFGHKFIEQSEILYCEKVERKYWVHTSKGAYTTTNNISLLEESLQVDKFVRVNRAALVSIKAIDHYSFWENDKYVLKLESGKEFIMSRQRLNKIKNRLKPIE